MFYLDLMRFIYNVSLKLLNEYSFVRKFHYNIQLGENYR